MPRYYFQISYAEREIVQALGAKWDNDCKSWYAPTEFVATVLKSYGYIESFEVCDKLFVSGFVSKKQQNSSLQLQITNFFTGK